MNTTTIKKRLEFYTKRLDNLYVAYNKLLPGSTSASLAMKSKRPSRKSMNWNRC